MSEEQTTGTDPGASGQASGGAETQPAAAPEAPSGQPGEGKATGQAAAAAAAPEAKTEEDTFFDPRELDPNLTPAYKQMQKAFTKKMQEISDVRKKAEAFDAFQKDPVGAMHQYAQRFGFQLTRPDQQQGQQAPPENWEPQSWQEVFDRASKIAEQRIMQQMAPAMQQMHQMRKTSIEQQLSEIDPTWQMYESEMRETLKSAPALANDPARLYRASVPPEVLESRAVQKALRKMESKTRSSSMSGASSTHKNQGGGLPTGPVSFADAVSAARAALAEQGIHKPR